MTSTAAAAATDAHGHRVDFSGLGVATTALTFTVSAKFS
jgi:hypothetical protein